MSQTNDDMLEEYDFSEGVRGKHASAMQGGYIVAEHDGDQVAIRHYVPIDPDVHQVFGGAERINATLRALIALVPSRPHS